MTRTLVVIGASAGGIPALGTILEDLPADLPAAVLVVVHTGANTSDLAEVLGRRSVLPVRVAADGDLPVPGHVFLPEPDRHLLVATDGRLRVTRGPRENGFRPAIDPLFRTAVKARGAGVIGVILSGGLDDGAYGLRAIVRAGGAAVVQHPDDAEVPSMPLAALRQTKVDVVRPASDIAAAIVRLCRATAGGNVDAMPRRDDPDPQETGEEVPIAEVEEALGAPSPITCPACGGVLWENEEEPGVVRYRCHVGHEYAPESLLAAHSESVEAALWTAVRILEQHAELRQRMARRAEVAGLEHVAQGFADRSQQFHRQAEDVRRLVQGEREPEVAQPARPAARRKAGAG